MLLRKRVRVVNLHAHVCERGRRVADFIKDAHADRHILDGVVRPVGPKDAALIRQI